ncbi:MAG: hypothetical protein H6721_10865 [Sandaracinus sp.]|nr:hypothetical protein [Sandaracinus sp.]MCB9618690.1 hypothetical protein [Sandaracinus sp.]MCB9632621.1 hypothetical protein [Sandaracinus sp.]
MRFTLLFAFALACGTSSEPALAPAPEPSSGPENEAPPEPTTEETDAPPGTEIDADGVVPPERAGTCTTAFDCTVVRDRCGGPHPRAVEGAPTPPSAPTPCPPATYALREPACDAEACVLIDVQFREHRTCEQSSDCEVIEGVCPGSFTAANRASRAAIEAEIRQRRMVVRCAAPPGTTRPASECLANVCVTRAP